ncbi:glycolipid transfer protein 3-like [Rhodamnia argentea]|uniref:Glycolipid transfer protein 3-like n=1 Tax=Rhodamnia argentea TaxID=178133 RepID=A0A8B8NQZ7_9MYRT|nr:glycolipid transfer protein 3-like [Rhodamnia argentea]XP_048130635.1 glycolipid transfer protein 3-like [Rhodamnia argentea]
MQVRKEREEEEEEEEAEVGIKRRRKMERWSEIKSAIEEVSMMVKLKPVVTRARNGDGEGEPRDDAFHVPTGPFLSLCSLVLEVLDKVGPTMAVLRLDIHQNVQRVELFKESDPLKYSNLVEMIKKEAGEGNARKSDSCSRAIVWLTRSMDLMAALLQRLAKDPGQKMEQAVEESYNVTLKPWHGWISSAAFKVALQLVPETKTFINLLKTKDESYENFKEDAQTLISLISPVLEEIHSILKLYGLDRLKSI